MNKYWLYMREDYRIGAESLDFKSIMFKRRSFYAGEPLKYIVVPGPIRGEIRELTDEQVQQITAEVSGLYINPHRARVGAFELNDNKDGFPVGKLLTIIPLETAHERGYLQVSGHEPIETIS
jgi:hypothetical protein